MKGNTTQKGRVPRGVVEYIMGLEPTETSCSATPPQGDTQKSDPRVYVVSRRKENLEAGEASETYVVKKYWAKKILEQFSVTPDRDCFENPENARFDKFYTPDQDALKQTWDPREVMWCNPPWSLWPQVAEKF